MRGCPALLRRRNLSTNVVDYVPCTLPARHQPDPHRFGEETDMPMTLACVVAAMTGDAEPADCTVSCRQRRTGSPECPPLPVAVVRRPVASDGAALGAWVWTWCPGCDELHPFTIESTRGLNGGVTWSWDGDLEAPTFEPSMLVNAGQSHPGAPVCHSFLRGGVWQFLGDSTHSLAGQSVPMVPLPAAWVGGLPDEDA